LIRQYTSLHALNAELMKPSQFLIKALRTVALIGAVGHERR
jgi:hypothetical protein